MYSIDDEGREVTVVYHWYFEVMAAVKEIIFVVEDDPEGGLNRPGVRGEHLHRGGYDGGA